MNTTGCHTATGTLPRPAAPNGFTLLELLIAATVAGMVMAAMGACLSLAMRMHEREARRDGERETAEALLRLLDRQLASWHPQAQAGEAAAVLGCRGDATSLQFSTRCSLRGLHGGGPVLVQYAYDAAAARFDYTETALPPLSIALGSPPEQWLAKGFRMAVPATGCTFAYRQPRRADWQSNWPAAREMPRAVRITLQVSGGTAPLRRQFAPGWLDLLEEDR